MNLIYTGPRIPLKLTVNYLNENYVFPDNETPVEVDEEDAEIILRDNPNAFRVPNDHEMRKVKLKAEEKARQEKEALEKAEKEAKKLIDSNPEKIRCPFPDCDKEYKDKNWFIKHLKEEHGLEIK
jgi:hypothetical protein